MARITNASAQKWARKIEAARSAAEDERFKINEAVALLEMLGEHIGTPGLCPKDLECQGLGLRVEYLAHQIERHAEDLNDELQKIESAATAMRRGDVVESEPIPSADGDNVVHLNQPDGDAA